MRGVTNTLTRGVGAILLTAGVVHAAQTPPDLQLVSIRRVASADTSTVTPVVRPAPVTVLPDGRIEARAVSVLDLARVAHGFEQVDSRHGVVKSTAGNWVERDRFDITAGTGRPWAGSIDSGQVSSEVRALVRRLLEERFQLKARIETRPVDVYALRLTRDGKPGKGLRPPSKQCLARGDASTTAKTPDCQVVVNKDVVVAPATTLAEFANVLPRVNGSPRDRPIIDDTGLTDRYDIVLTLGVPLLTGASADDVQDAFKAELLAVMKSQLSLELRPAKLPIPTLLVESARRPAED